MKINCNFEGGNIETIICEDPSNIELKIRPDKNADFIQWFYFNFTGTQDQEYIFKITNAGESTHPKGWQNYKIFASYDQNTWFRIPTQYDGKNLIIRHILTHESIYLAYFVPYSQKRLESLINKAKFANNCIIQTVGFSIENRPIQLLIFGKPSNMKRICWVITRQHPGETMGSWFCEGLINRLIQNDSLTQTLLSKMVFYIIPNMNPDGCFYGNLRANSVGINLNREWQNPDKNKSPEVYYVQQEIDKTGVDFFLDVHGDEEIPYVFTIDNDQLDDYDQRIKTLGKKFKDLYHHAAPDFQTVNGYPPGEYTNDELATLASGAAYQRHHCLAFTLEMPFSDNANLPNEKYGWSPDRSLRLGAALIESLYGIIDEL